MNFVKALRLVEDEFSIVGVEKNRYYLEMSPVDRRYLVEHEPGGDRAYMAKIARIVVKEKIDFVHAQPDGEVKILSDRREVIPAATFLPSKSGVRIFQNKWETYQKLLAGGVSVAQTIRLASRESIAGAFRKLSRPVWVRAIRGTSGRGSLLVRTAAQARMWIQYWVDELKVSWNDFSLAEYLPGREVSWLSLWKNGELVCSQQKERIEWVQSKIAPSGVGGTTAVQKTVDYEAINDICTRTILAVEHTPNGIYVVDTKENSQGVACVTEVNPGRFFTTSLFFATAGVNMPFYYVRLGLGLPIPAVKRYNSVPAGIYWIRITDGGPTLVEDEQWSSTRL